jgi:hypothetical protein
MKTTFTLTGFLSVMLCLGGLSLVTTQTGCSTVQQAAGTRIIVRRATVEVLKKHPTYKPAVVASAVAIDQLLLSPTIDRDKIAAAVATLKIRELKGTDGALLLRDVLDLIDVAVADKPLVGDGLPKLRAILGAVSGGLAEGAAFTTP